MRQLRDLGGDHPNPCDVAFWHKRTFTEASLLFVETAVRTFARHVDLRQYDIGTDLKG